MNKSLLILSALLAGFAVGCGGSDKATADDKANIDRLTKQGMTPQSSGQTQNQAGVPISGQVEDP